MSNSNNKSQLKDLLYDVITSKDIQIRRSEDIADTLIVKTAIECSSVEVKADDTDVLIILLHHVQAMNNTVCLTSSRKTFDIKPLSRKNRGTCLCRTVSLVVTRFPAFLDSEKLKCSSGCV